MKKIIPIILVGIILAGTYALIYFQKERELHEISPEKAVENRVETEGIIIDVRTKGEYDNGSLKGALVGYNYSSGEFEEKLDSLDKTKTYYLYCASGNRSGKAARLMTEKGFENVHNLGGYNDLVESGFEKSDNSQ
ncbi:MAG: rhodanese-like domain-containing protein [Balneola sp.]